MTRRKDPTTVEKLANSIRSLRKSKYSGHGGQKSAYTAFGVDGTIWSRWESGRSAPDDVNQRKLAKFFGVTLAELRGDHVETPSDYAEHLRANPSISADFYAERFTALEKGVFQNNEGIVELRERFDNTNDNLMELSERFDTLIALFREGSDRTRPAAAKKRAATTKPPTKNNRPRKK